MWLDRFLPRIYSIHIYIQLESDVEGVLIFCFCFYFWGKHFHFFIKFKGRKKWKKGRGVHERKKNTQKRHEWKRKMWKGKRKKGVSLPDFPAICQDVSVRLSACPPVRVSACPSVRLSVRSLHTFPLFRLSGQEFHVWLVFVFFASAWAFDYIFLSCLIFFLVFIFFSPNWPPATQHPWENIYRICRQGAKKKNK